MGNKCAAVLGPNGDVLTLDNLPASDVKRWVPRRKAEIVTAVSGGLLSLHEVETRYGISCEEFCSWVRAYERSGLGGLRAIIRRTPMPENGLHDGAAAN
jgi:hypothetical protein